MLKICFNIVVLLATMHISFAQQNTKPTNIILIVADDLGYTDLGCYGSSFYETPNLNALAAKGILFTQNYAASPVCSPTRACMLTGKNPITTGVTDWIPGRQANGNKKPYEKLTTPNTQNQLALEETTIAEYAVANGYKTFLAGKWHLGEDEKYWPLQQGFQINKGGWSKGSPTGKINDTTGGFFTPYKNPTLSDGKAGEYLTDRLTNETIAFIETNKQQPFFIMYSLYAVHNPLQAPTALINKYKAKQQQAPFINKQPFLKDEDWMKNEPDWKRRTIQNNAAYAAMIENMDANIGLLLQTLTNAGIADNTMIIFTSDNGGLSTAEGSPTVNNGLRAGKGWLYEGGIRVPLIMYHKNNIQKGSISHIPVATADVFTTMATAINKNYKKEKNIEGQNIFALLKNKEAATNRTLYWYYPHYSNQGGKPSAAIRKGNYKLLYYFEDKTIELFDIKKDSNEKNNIATTHIEIANSLQQSLLHWLQINKAAL